MDMSYIFSDLEIISMLRDFSTKIVELEQKYTRIKTINNKVLGITELVQDANGQIFVKKILPTVNKTYLQLLDNPVAAVPKIIEVLDGFNCGFIFGESHQPVLITYVIEEFVDGITLKQLLREQFVFTEAFIYDIFLQLTQILIDLHRHKIIHRDIKPDNIMLLSDRKTVYLFDFGAARISKEDEKEEDTVLLGTRGFAAPEQFGSSASDARTDIYGLGKAMQLLAGADYTGYLKPIFELCTEFDPKRRITSATALMELLKNPQDKLLFLQSRAVSGDCEAYVELGDVYKSGLLVSKDISKAVDYYRIAADNGSAAGMFKYGEYCETGIAVSRDYKIALELYHKAAEKDYGPAYGKLGWMSYSGKGTPKDYNVAVFYFRKAVQSDNFLAWSLGKYGLALCMLNGTGLSKDELTAIEFIKELYDRGTGVGTYALANLYERGEHIGKDLAKAFALYKEAAEKEWFQAFTQVGKCYYYGLGTKTDYAQAFYYLEKGLQVNDPAAKAYLSIMYVYEDGVEQDCAKAYTLCREAAEDGNNVASFFLANYFYKYGAIVEKNDRERFRWYKRAADGGYKPALLSLGDCYKDGIGTTVSINKAVECYEMAGAVEKANALKC